MRTHALCLLLVLAPSSLHAADPIFPGPALAFPYSLQDLAISDLDGDGFLDVVVPATGFKYQAAVGVRLSDGGMDYGPVQEYLPNVFARYTAIADVDGDGIDDLLSVSTAKLWFSKGIGDGTFAVATSTPNSVSPRDLVAVDFNGDGDVDVCIAALIGGSAALMLGNGDGTFQPELAVPAGGPQADLETRDLDGDGALDIVATLGFGAVGLGVVLGNGDATFQPPAVLAPSGDAVDSAIVDLDEDGALDLVVVTSSPNELVRFLGNGDGTFQAPVASGLPADPSAVDVGDVNRDGHVDVGWSSVAADIASVWFGAGDGTFPSTRDVDIGAGHDPRRLSLSDMDGDGASDLVLLNVNGGDSCFCGGDVALYYGDGLGELLGNDDIDVGADPDLCRAADLDGDGHADLVVLNPELDSFAVALGNGDGSFAAPLTYGVGPGDRPSWFAVGDVSGDGVPDVVTSNSLSQDVSVVLGVGGGAFGGATVLPAGGATPRGVELGDATGDGVVDLLVATQLSNAVAIHAGLGGGAFAAPVLIPTHPAPSEIEIGLVDGDNLPDLVTANLLTSAVSYLRGLGGGAFAPPQLVHSHNGGVLEVVLADLDADTDLDLVIGRFSTIWVRLGDGVGGFGPAASFDAHGAHLAVADVDVDGAADILGSGSANRVRILRNAGAGVFEPPRSYLSVATTRGMAVDDFDEDGRPDVASTYRNFSEGARVLLNAGGTPWCGAGHGHGASELDPTLVASGSLDGGSTVTIDGIGLPPATTAMLVVGISAWVVPFGGGVLVPSADILAPLATGPGGAVSVSAPVPPAGLPPGVPFWLQAWAFEPAAPGGFVSTNAVKGLTP